MKQLQDQNMEHDLRKIVKMKLDQLTFIDKRNGTMAPSPTDSESGGLDTSYDLSGDPSRRTSIKKSGDNSKGTLSNLKNGKINHEALIKKLSGMSWLSADR